MSDPNNTLSNKTQSGAGQSGAGMSSVARDLRGQAADAMAKVSDVAQQAVGEAKRSASSLAAEATQRAKGALQERIVTGADLIGHMAASTRVAADSLDPNAPQIAGFVREAGERMEEFSRGVRDRSIDDLIETSTDFARRQPAALFGAAAACGFLLFRLFKASSSSSFAPAERRDGGHRPGDVYPRQAESPPITSGQFHGP
jgi:ElaB/YqjD/DUF883 family membrane-anchored ribosome-binding protein